MTEADRARLPDVASAAVPQPAAELAWVGMQGMAMPLQLDGNPAEQRCGSARVSAWVDLAERQSRGIHMSRLYALAGETLARDSLSPTALRHVLRGFLDSHEGLSTRARLRADFELLLRRPALKSDRHGWIAYPASVCATLQGNQCSIEMTVTVSYSSTCPASAALSRQVVAEHFAAEFADDAPLEREAVQRWLASEAGMAATPHSQRSEARVRVRLAPSLHLPLRELVDTIEAALQTPVQAAVRREDEQAFAERNAANLMFCEDAARRLHAALDADARYADFHIRASHFESLHPHDAVAVAVKGVGGGFDA
ncbi:MAG TPA: GTP cyclohydrolase FolE2 [Rhodanobacteraceae bacterium]|nr:GTP cyclohydrolase FolE2 [Rhodanobacteraceae bacterium]